jgi:hypothetical protein
VVVTVPGLKVVSEANTKCHWAERWRRAGEQKAATLVALTGVGRGVRTRLQAARGLKVRFVRVGGKKMDSDNLAGAFKAVRDELARWLGVDDGDDWYTWEWPAQEHGERCIRIEMTTT